MSDNFEYPQDPDVYWEKWVNPYAMDLDGIEWPGYEDPGEFEDIDDDDLEEFKSSLKEHQQQIKTLFTPMGPIPMTEHSMPSKLFKFWVGHSNFNITPDVVNIIEHVEGVETLNVWTRYRFRVGIGKLFKDSSVMFEIKEAMLKYLGDKNGKKNNSIPTEYGYRDSA